MPQFIFTKKIYYSTCWSLRRFSSKLSNYFSKKTRWFISRKLLLEMFCFVLYKLGFLLIKASIFFSFKAIASINVCTFYFIWVSKVNQVLIQVLVMNQPFIKCYIRAQNSKRVHYHDPREMREEKLTWHHHLNPRGVHETHKLESVSLFPVRYHTTTFCPDSVTLKKALSFD